MATTLAVEIRPAARVPQCYIQDHAVCSSIVFPVRPLKHTGHVVVAVFVIEREDSASLAEALTELGNFVPDWRPSAFMIDASEVEATAIQSVFHGMAECAFQLPLVLLIFQHASFSVPVSFGERIIASKSQIPLCYPASVPARELVR